MAAGRPESHQRAHSARSGGVDRPPPLFAEGEKRLPVTIRAFRLRLVPGQRRPRWEYDLWITDTGRWTGRLDHPATLALLAREGLDDDKARRMLDQARKRRARASRRWLDQQHR
jgi:hypothetical protein